jgi:death-on-curing protein
LTLSEILQLHSWVIQQTGGSTGVRDLSALQSAVAMPRMTFEERELYPDLETKAAALCFSIVMNHPFVDGNKRVGHAAMEIFLVLNGFELDAPVEESETTMLTLAAGKLSRDQLSLWVRRNTRPSTKA